jgi:8-oxo-dGTP diphosphatase
MLYKLLLPEEWDALAAHGSFSGSAADRRDGFMHFSTAGQVVETAAKHFAGNGPVVLAEADPARLPQAPLWEPSRGGQLFPHLYGPLPLSAVARHWRLERGDGGALRFPDLPGLIAPDWAAWRPRETASLCFIIEDGRVLLIHKKRGLGAGKVNAPGGRLEPGETLEECAARETREEVGVTPTGLRRAGELRFQFVDGYSLRCAVFTASGRQGEPVETAEADPFWRRTQDIPFDRMWTDDRHWIPWMLAGRPFLGRFHFDGDRMLSGHVEPA